MVDSDTHNVIAAGGVFHIKLVIKTFRRLGKNLRMYWWVNTLLIINQYFHLLMVLLFLQKRIFVLSKFGYQVANLEMLV
jgi:hypothetical protein